MFDELIPVFELFITRSFKICYVEPFQQGNTDTAYLIWSYYEIWRLQKTEHIRTIIIIRRFNNARTQWKKKHC